MRVAAVTKYHRLGGIAPKPLFLTILDAGKSESSVPAGVVSTESALPGLQMVLIPLMGTPTSGPSHFLKAPALSAITVGIRVTTSGFWGNSKGERVYLFEPSKSRGLEGCVAPS